MENKYAPKILKDELRQFIEYRINQSNGWKGADQDDVNEIITKVLLTIDDVVDNIPKDDTQTNSSDFYIYDSLDRPLGINPKYR